VFIDHNIKAYTRCMRMRTHKSIIVQSTELSQRRHKLTKISNNDVEIRIDPWEVFHISQNYIVDATRIHVVQQSNKGFFYWIHRSNTAESSNPSKKQPFQDAHHSCSIGQKSQAYLLNVRFDWTTERLMPL